MINPYQNNGGSETNLWKMVVGLPGWRVVEWGKTKRPASKYLAGWFLSRDVCTPELLVLFSKKTCVCLFRWFFTDSKPWDASSFFTSIWGIFLWFLPNHRTVANLTLSVSWRLIPRMDQEKRHQMFQLLFDGYFGGLESLVEFSVDGVVFFQQLRRVQWKMSQRWRYFLWQ